MFVLTHFLTKETITNTVGSYSYLLTHYVSSPKMSPETTEWRWMKTSSGCETCKRRKSPSYKKRLRFFKAKQAVDSDLCKVESVCSLVKAEGLIIDQAGKLKMSNLRYNCNMWNLCKKPLERRATVNLRMIFHFSVIWKCRQTLKHITFKGKGTQQRPEFKLIVSCLILQNLYQVSRDTNKRILWNFVRVENSW